MKTTIVAVVWALSLAVAVPQYALAAPDQPAAPQPQAAPPELIAAADPQTAAPQAQPAAPGAQSEQPTIKDPAEYNAYVAAYQQKDPNSKISALEAFLTQYPNSVMKNTALELLMGTYQQAGNQPKVVDTAKRLLTSDPNNLRALALLTFLARANIVQQHDIPQNLADLQKYCKQGLDAIKANQKPAGISDADFEKLKKDTQLIFNGGCGFGALQSKDFQNAATYLRAAVDQEPNDLQNVYPLATAYLAQQPPDTLNGIFYLARAVALAPAGPSHDAIQSYLQKVYQNYHGSTDGLDYVLSTAKTATSPPPDWGQKITKYVPPTPEQQAHDLVKDKTPDQIKLLSFGEWELVLSAGSPEDQAKVWDVIKNNPLQMEGTVIEAVSNTEIHVAGSEDDIEAKRADITLTMSGPIPAPRMPKAGDTFQFEGTPTAYTATPFMMTMSNGKLLRKASEKPAPTRPVHRRPAHPAAQ
jgi:tetratricopeptide (TPR) repeat protein